jgi:hypothetical protein
MKIITGLISGVLLGIAVTALLWQDFPLLVIAVPAVTFHMAPIVSLLCLLIPALSGLAGAVIAGKTSS